MQKDKRKEMMDTENTTTVSLIICAKNESSNLQIHLPHIANIDYPHYLLEVILVNDQSTDDTGNVMDTFASQFHFIKVIHIPLSEIKDLPGKKYALKKAIAVAKNDWILLTDADCKPMHLSWIKEMIAANPSEAPMVLGYGAYEVSKGSLNAFIQFETLHSAVQYMSYAHWQMPYMGVGRNLLYKTATVKEAFDSPELNIAMQQTVSGDDDLMVSFLSKKVKVETVSNSETHTISKVPKYWNDYFKQKSRHTSSSKFYATSTKLLLGLYAFSHLVFWIGGIAILFFLISDAYFNAGLRIIVSGILGIVIVFKAINYYKWKQKLKNPNSVINLLVFDFFWAIYNVILSPYIFWKNKQKWN